MEEISRKVRSKQTEPNIRAAKKFLFLLTGDENPVVTFQTFPERDKSASELARTMHGTLTEHLDTLKELNRAGAAVTVCFNETDLKGCSKKNVVAVRGGFADLDGSPLDPVKEWSLKPHFITETSPDRYHAYYLAAGIPLGEFSAIQSALVEIFSSDSSVKNLNRCVRLPGFIHQKGAPFLSRIVETSDHPRFTFEQLSKALGLDSKKDDRSDCVPEDPAIDNDHGLAKAVSLGSEAADSCFRDQKRGRHGVALNLGFDCRRAGLSHEMAIKAAEVFCHLSRKEDSDGKHKPLAEDEVRDAVLNAYKPDAKVEGLEESPEVIALSELMERELPPIRWVAERILPEGLTLFCGPPKKGKSWAMLDLALSVATGSSLFGHFPCEQGGVLYLYLEDGERVAKERGAKILNDDKVPDNLSVAFNWSRGEQAVRQLDDWLKKHPGTCLVIVDCLAEIRGEKRREENLYDYDRRSLKALHSLGMDHAVAIVVVHHTRKAPSDDPGNMILGTNGLASAADSTWIMRTVRDNAALLNVRGRNVEAQNIGLQFDKDTWRWRWNDSRDLLRSEQRNAVIDFLQNIYPDSANIAEVRGAANLSPSGARMLLSRMVKDGEIERCSRGQYRARASSKEEDPNKESGNKREKSEKEGKKKRKKPMTIEDLI